jgi:hypothetical protein
MQKRIICALLFVMGFTTRQISYAQVFLNGSFESNTALPCDYNMANATFTSKMANSTGFGASSQLDIMNTTCPYGTPQNGNWMVSLATNAGNTDAFTTMLSAPLVATNTYTMSFYDRGDPNYPPGVPIQIGISTVAGALGTIVYTGPVPLNGPWSLRSFTFVAPNNGQHVSISTTGAPLWTFVDNFCLGCPLVLPIELFRFTGECKEEEIVLNWSTMTEKNNDHFSIERSEDGVNFIHLGDVKGAGTSNKMMNYTFTDGKQSEKQAYYHIKQTDFDGSITYSQLITVDLCKTKGDLSFEIVPNPVNEVLNISVKHYSMNTKLKIMDQMGKPVREIQIESIQNAVDVSMLRSGLYFIVISNSEKTISGKFLKN